MAFTIERFREQPPAVWVDYQYVDDSGAIIGEDRFNMGFEDVDGLFPAAFVNKLKVFWRDIIFVAQIRGHLGGGTSS